MKIKLEKLLERCVEGINLSEVSYKYAPIYVKNHFARAKDEFVTVMTVRKTRGFCG